MFVDGQYRHRACVVPSPERRRIMWRRVDVRHFLRRVGERRRMMRMRMMERWRMSDHDNEDDDADLDGNSSS